MKIAVGYKKYARRIRRYLESARELVIGPESKLVMFTDLHVSDGGPADDFKLNANLLAGRMVPYYKQNGYRGIYTELLELWESSWKKIMAYAPNHAVLWGLAELNRPFYIPGNHDAKAWKIKHGILSKMIICEALKLIDVEGRVIALIFHGYEADWWNCGGIQTKLVVVPVVKWIWPMMQQLGAKSEPPFSPRRHREKVTGLEKHYSRTAKEEEIIVLVGHTHVPKLLKFDEGVYVNAGSGCKSRKEKIASRKGVTDPLHKSKAAKESGVVTCVEISDGELRLGFWDEDEGRQMVLVEALGF